MRLRCGNCCGCVLLMSSCNDHNHDADSKRSVCDLICCSVVIRGYDCECLVSSPVTDYCLYEGKEGLCLWLAI